MYPKNKPYKLPDGNVQIAFSGGRTSAYMLHQILETNGPLPERVKVSFQNTGREMDETYDFIQECGERWNVPIVWLEYVKDDPWYEVVSHNSASRDGEPFEALIRKRKYLPNQQARFCTQELKVNTSRRYLVDRGWKEWQTATGIRADEIRRQKPRIKIKGERAITWQPLIDAGAMKEDIQAFWKAQPFDLMLPMDSALGNCDGCFLKAEKKLAAFCRDYPERHAWWQRMEMIASELTSSPGGARFRKEYTRKDLQKFMDSQGDWIDDDYFCQQDGGECFG